MNPIKDNSGTALIEFAFVLPLLLLILFASVEFGVAFFNKAMITNASREGARAGIVFNTAFTNNRMPVSDIEQIAKDYCEDHVITFGAAATPNVSVVREGDNMGQNLTVTVTYDYGFLVLPNFLSGLGSSLQLTGTSIMRNE